MFETTPRLLKIVLVILFVFALAALALNILKLGVGDTSGIQTAPLSKPVTTKRSEMDKTTPLSREEAVNQSKAIQDQVNAGTLSSEEAAKELNAIGSHFPMPALPSDARK